MACMVHNFWGAATRWTAQSKISWNVGPMWSIQSIIYRPPRGDRSEGFELNFVFLENLNFGRMEIVDMAI